MDLNDHKQLLDNISTSILWLDDELIVQYANPSAENLLAMSARHLINKPLPANLFADPKALEQLEEHIKSGHPFTNREAELCLHNFQRIHVDYSVTPLRQANQNSLIIIELRPLDRLLRISKEDSLIHNHQATRALVRGVAHEIKNPLGGIRGAAQLLAKAINDKSLKEYTDVIIEEADRLRNLADQMLGPRKLPRYQATNILECLERVRSLILAETPSSLVIVRDYDPSIPELMADSGQLIQALLNITRNAQQALHEGHTPNGRITFRTRVARQFTIGDQRYRLILKIEIEDNGPGISSELLDTLFYPMVSGRANGTGLGLSISQSIINQHKGLIECDSKAGSTCFRLLLPLIS